MLGLLVAGLVIGVAGLLSIVFAIPMKEFSLGNTLIVSGVIAACAGAILVAASMLLRELRTISQALAAGRLPTVLPAPEVRRPATGAAAPAPREEEAPMPPPGWAEAPEQTSAEAGPPGRKRRNLLFMSTRRDRLAGSEATEEQPGATMAPPESPPTPTASFEDAWPASERTRPEPAPARPAPIPSRPAAPPPAFRRATETQQVTVLKSGVVDGMAYSLYSDGSIEAQLPEGMIRFASIDELRHHLDQRGG
jgi:hypothetical protein